MTQQVNQLKSILLFCLEGTILPHLCVVWWGSVNKHGGPRPHSLPIFMGTPLSTSNNMGRKLICST